jgi:hypothetical protein
MPPARQQRDDAQRALDELRERGAPVVLDGDRLAGVLGILDQMLGGDPWQEMEYAVGLIGLLPR